MTTLNSRRESPPRRARATWRLPLLLFLAVGTVLSGVVWFSNSHLPLDSPPYPGDPSTKDVIGGWLQYDSGWYIDIAANGYHEGQVAAFEAGQQASVAFFPGYPLTVRAVSRATGDDFGLAAQLTTAAGGLIAVLLFWRWCRDRLDPSARTTALLLMVLYPYGWFLYGSGYGDAMFLAATLGAFVLLERDHVVLAGLAGALASVTRITGLAVIVGLAAVLLERRGALVRAEEATASGSLLRRERSRWRFDRTKLRRGDVGVLLSIGGVASYSLFLWQLVGDPLAFNTVQAAPGWNQGTGPKTWIKYSFFAQVLRGEITYGVRLVAQALLCLLFLVGAWFVLRRLGWGYAAYVVALISLPLVGSSTFQGFGRYLLGAFPVFAVGGEVLASRQRLRQVVIATGAVALVMLTSLFARGYYLT